jgi:biotin carboxyl carrier protein
MKTTLRQQDNSFDIDLHRDGDQFTLQFMEKKLNGKIIQWIPPYFSLQIGPREVFGAVYRGKNFVDVHLPEGNYRLKYQEAAREGASAHAPGELTSPMPGKILKVLVNPGDQVRAGDTLMILEAMKMEHKILSPLDGTVQKIMYNEGDRVAQDVELVKIES